MRQYTNEIQTAKLIELGFEKPKGLADAEPSSGVWVRPAYTIGELIEVLPDYINENFVKWKIQTTGSDVKWSVCWDCFETGQFHWIRADELIDALYNMIVKLKEEGVI